MNENTGKVETQEIFSNEFATLWFYPNNKIIHHQFHKYTSSDDFKFVLSTGSQLFEEHGCIKWLSDDANLSVVSQEDADWAREHWYLRNKKVGWKYWAMVKPKNVIGKMSMKRHVRAVDDPEIILKIFDNPEEAFDWLDKQE